jgi:hypothetical protein
MQAPAWAVGSPVDGVDPEHDRNQSRLRAVQDGRTRDHRRAGRSASACRSPTFRAARECQGRQSARAWPCTSAKRSSRLPEVPAISENTSGLRRHGVVRTLRARRGIAGRSCARSMPTSCRRLNTPDTQRRLEQHGVDPSSSTPESSRLSSRPRPLKWAKVVKDAGIPRSRARTRKTGRHPTRRRSLAKSARTHGKTARTSLARRCRVFRQKSARTRGTGPAHRSSYNASFFIPALWMIFA